MAPTPRSGRASVDAVRQEVLNNTYGLWIYRYCLRRTADRELAEDLDLSRISRNEAWRQRGKAVHAADAELPWLYGIAANVVRNQWRKERRHRAALARLPRPRDEADLARRRR